MPKVRRATPDQAARLDDSTGWPLIPELFRDGLQQLIELEVAAIPGADRYGCTEERLGYRNRHRHRHRHRTPNAQVRDLELVIP